jgi:hypothetical protein
VAVAIRKFEIEMIQIGNASVHMADYLWLKVKESGVVERDPYVAGESCGCIMTHRSKMELVCPVEKRWNKSRLASWCPQKSVRAARSRTRK